MIETHALPAVKKLQRSAAQRRVYVFETLERITQAHDPQLFTGECLALALTTTGAGGGQLTADEQVITTVGSPTTVEATTYTLTLPLTHQAGNGQLELWGLGAPATGEQYELAALIGQRWLREWHSRHALVVATGREARLEALLGIASLMSSTLDREQLLQQILMHTCSLLRAEAASIFLLDAETGDLILRIASGSTAEQVRNVRVPKGKGIAGYVAASGETVVVNDPASDPRFYGQVDRKTKFQTRALMCVPLRTRSIQLGAELGVTEERIVGVAQVLNPIDDQLFTADDVELFETLGSQAATVLEVAGLYANMHELFTDVIEAITAAIDAKDEYTQGHSRRVSSYSTEIARELGLPADFVRRVRISGILHDVGKIGVPDAVLKKPGPLDDAEFAFMKEHPIIGERIMATVRLLKHELPGLVEHHERPDGRGYPYGLKEQQLSLLGRIIAVADSFDAMTSNRAYRKALSMDEVRHRITAGAGTQWDADCVAALWRAYDAGRILTQAAMLENWAG